MNSFSGKQRGMCSCVRSSTAVNIQSFSYLSELPRLLHTPGSLLEYESSDTELAEGGEKERESKNGTNGRKGGGK